MTRDVDIEPERYEFNERKPYTFAVNRRDFLRFGGAGIFVCLTAPSTAAQEVAPSVRVAIPPPATNVGAWLHIDEKGHVTVYSGKVEIGQNIRTSLAQAVADELGAPIEAITMVLGDTDLTPFDLGTFGSFTTPQNAPQVRRAAVVARTMLVDIAAARWGVRPDEVTVAQGMVRHATTNRAASFGELTHGQKLAREIPGDVALTPAGRWTVAGTGVRKVDARDIVTGRMKYVSDISRPGMLHGKVVRPPAVGATLASADDAAASRVTGAMVVKDGNFIGVAAATQRQAEEAVKAISAKWTPRTGQPSSTTIYDYLKSNAARPEARPAPLEQALTSAERRLDRTYTVAFIAHVPLEPRAAVAEWNGDRVTVWTGTQRPFAVREEVAQAFRIDISRVRVIVPHFGSAYGGKHTGEMAVEAARLAKGAGKPVKVVWTRAEEFQWAYFRPAGVIEIAAGTTADGRMLAWDFVNYHSGRSAIDGVYDVPHSRTQYVTLEPPLRSGSYRGLAATANNFAREVHVDELASIAKLDPVAFRLKNLKDPRARAVLEAAAERFGWRGTAPAGRGVGIAVGFEKGGYVATAVEIEPRPNMVEPRVVRVVVSYECGAIVNPDGLRHQIAGAIVQGIGGALWEAVDFQDGRILNGSMRQYRVPRFTDVPPIDVVMLNRKDLPSVGAGETPLIALAPALSGALFQMTGERRRSLPLTPPK